MHDRYVYDHWPIEAAANADESFAFSLSVDQAREYTWLSILALLDNCAGEVQCACSLCMTVLLTINIFGALQNVRKKPVWKYPDYKPVNIARVTKLIFNKEGMISDIYFLRQLTPDEQDEVVCPFSMLESQDRDADGRSVQAPLLEILGW